MEKIIVESPSKINLGLNIVEKRTDGYHNLETIFFPLLLKDIIMITKSEKTEFSSTSTELNSVSDNLILKAKKLLEEKANKKFILKIFVEKNIPIGGGLGGGSSNAASTLKAINKLCKLDFSYQDLFECALDLGSDVPYFLNPIPVYAESKGEKLNSINLELPYPVLVVNSGINIQTGWAFSKVNPIKPEKRLKDIFNSELIDFESMKVYVKNDFEDVIFQEYPMIEQIKKELYDLGAQFALMTGTGSSVFGIFSNLQKAYWAEDHFKEKEYFTFLNIPFEKGSIT